MKPRLLGGLVAVCLVALGWVGCVDGDETDEMCLSGCQYSATFALATPLAGREFAISVGFPDGTDVRIDCQPGDGSVACIPVTSRVGVSFAADGSLLSLGVGYPSSGTYAVQIDVDGMPAAAGAFRVQGWSPPIGDPCGGYVAPAPCPGAQMFTIAN